MHTTITCFGETLWDVLPDGKMPGGAPMNVAVHLKYNGHAPLLISRVGNDEAGKELLQFLTEKGLSTACIQHDEIQQTGIVTAHVGNKHEITYTIVEPVAWDYIGYEEQAAQQVAASDMFIYGSLSSRCKTTYETLFRYLPLAKLKVLDVNLRPPHYTPRRIQQLLTHASIVKLNHHELTEIVSWYGKYLGEKESLAYLKNRYDLQMVIVTRGENGAAVLTDSGYMEHPGFQVTVEDTIGSGDAFLAAFLHQMLRQTDTQKALEIACATGACVATQRGATPQFSENEIAAFMAQQHLSAIPKHSLIKDS